MRVLVLAMVGILPASVWGLDPSEIFIVVNKTEPKSRDVADHYCKLRKVPTTNIIALDLPFREDISRADYETKLLTPLRAALLPHRNKVKVILTVYAVPLRVGPQASTDAEQKELVGVRADLAKNRREAEIKQRTVNALEEGMKKTNSTEPSESLIARRKDLAEYQKLVHELEVKERQLTHAESEAAVDSELMQIWWPFDYPKDRWVLNPLNWRMPPAVKMHFPPTVMTCRLDGQTADIAKRLVTDAVWAEEHGLKGKVYVDARGIKLDTAADPTATGLGGYDESMREMAELLKSQAKMPVVLDDLELLFSPFSCPDCALYCGWYSVRNYVACCKLNRGAVAWHLASYEMLSLKNSDAQWCGNLLKDGACATLGAVAEPYTIAFPRPAEFFGFLATGEYTLVECYARTVMLNSWMICLVGDPLYNPYKNDQRLKADQVPQSPKGAKFIVP